MNKNKKKIQELEQQILLHNYCYYTLDEPKISDYEYDLLVKELCFLEKKKSDSISINFTSNIIGSDLSKDLATVKHLSPMLSLNNISNINQFINFEKKIRSKLLYFEKEIKFCCELKLDGVAVSLIYKNGCLLEAATRGNGLIGEKVTENIKTIKVVPTVLNGSNIPELLEIRGEVIMFHQDFLNLNIYSKNTGGRIFSNPRNAAAGSLRHINKNITKKRKLTFFCHSFGIINDSLIKINSHYDILQQFKEWGIPIQEKIKLCSNYNEILFFYKNIESNRSLLNFDIDGIVVKLDSIDFQNRLLHTNRAPRWAIACKFISKKSTTKILDVQFQVGRTGLITPVACVIPIILGGVIIRKVSLYNKNEMDKLGICLGDVVTIGRAGDVIPKIFSVNLSYRKENKLQSISFPNHCPVCRSLKIKTKNNIIRCMEGMFCIAQRKKFLIHFFSKKALYIKGLGGFIIDQLVDKNLIYSPVDLFFLKKKHFLKLSRISEKSAIKILSSIYNSKKTTLTCFLYGLGITDVGEGVAKKLAFFFRNIDRIMNSNLEELKSLTNIGNKLSNNIFNFMKDKNNRIMISKLKEIYSINN